MIEKTILLQVLENYKKKSYDELCNLTEEEKYFYVNHQGKIFPIEIQVKCDNNTVKVFISITIKKIWIFNSDFAVYFAKSINNELLENDEAVF
jgi:hypothetical protein